MNFNPISTRRADQNCCRALAAAIQEHIGAVLTRVRSLMSDVSTFKSQRATADAPSSADQPDGSVLPSNGSASGRQLIDTSLSDYQDGVAARLLLQQWQARQQDTKGSEAPKAFTPTQASFAFGRLAVQTTSLVDNARFMSVLANIDR
jgi:hypothetical protein